MGPILFNIYINDIFDIHNLNIIGYADDLILTCFDKEISVAIYDMNQNLLKIANYMNHNRLQINYLKSGYILYCNKNKKFDLDFHIYLNSIQLNEINEIRYLGVTFDKKLNWVSHIDNIALSVSKILGMINRIKTLVNRQTLLNIYKSCILPKLEYGILIWGTASTFNINKLQVLQNRFLRTTYNLSYSSSVAILYARIKLDNIQMLYIKNLLLFFHRYNFNDFYDKTYFYESYRVLRRETGYSIRDFNIKIPPRSFLNIGLKSVVSSSVRLWNCLHPELKLELTYNKFRRKLRNIFLVHDLFARPILQYSNIRHVMLN